MSNPYDPVEQGLRADLVDARLKLHHEKARREGSEHEIRKLQAEVAKLNREIKRLDAILDEIEDDVLRCDCYCARDVKHDLTKRMNP